MEHIGFTGRVHDVSGIQAELAEHPKLWNQYRGRLRGAHRETDDIWLRFAEGNINDFVGKLETPHVSVWYPAADSLPAAKALAEEIFASTGAGKLGGVLLIRVPPGKKIYPHRDLAWHAAAHKKLAVQIYGARHQVFDFEDGGLEALPGQEYWLDNAHPHWVLNPTDEPWVNMTVCYRDN